MHFPDPLSTFLFNLSTKYKFQFSSPRQTNEMATLKHVYLPIIHYLRQTREKIDFLTLTYSNAQWYTKRICVIKCQVLCTILVNLLVNQPYNQVSKKPE